MKNAKNISEISASTKKARLSFMQTETRNILAELKSGVSSYDICISKGNRKTGDLVPSFSTRPILDCRNCKTCSGLCYDIRNDCMYKTVMSSRSRNQALLEFDRDRVFSEISLFCKGQVAFRWHVGGDIQDTDYLERMCKVARENKHCKFLAFTKCFDIVNRYFEGGKHHKPSNFQIVFSGWKGMEIDNPLNFPTSHPIFADGTTSAKNLEKAFRCTGNCSHCRTANSGCWALAKGEEVVFNAH